MKKIISFIFALLLTVSGYAVEKSTIEAVKTVHQDVKSLADTIHSDVKGVITTVYGDSKDAIEELYPEVKSAIIEIAKAIGVAAEHLYGVLVKKYIVDGIVQTIPFIIGIILLIIGWIKTEKYIKANSEQITWPILYPLSLSIIGIICLCCVNYNTMFMGIINPEYGAINYILEFTKEMIK